MRAIIGPRNSWTTRTSATLELDQAFFQITNGWSRNRGTNLDINTIIAPVLQVMVIPNSSEASIGITYYNYTLQVIAYRWRGLKALVKYGLGGPKSLALIKLAAPRLAYRGASQSTRNSCLTLYRHRSITMVSDDNLH